MRKTFVVLLVAAFLRNIFDITILSIVSNLTGTVIKQNERLILELRAARIECLQKHFPDVPDHNKTLAYAMLSKKVLSQRNHIYDIEAKVSASSPSLAL